MLFRSWLLRECQVPYAQEGQVRRLIEQHEARLQTVQHHDQVRLQFEVEEGHWPALEHALNESGRGLLQWLDTP